eukprot:5151506-Amphidinium_carterae.1
MKLAQFGGTYKKNGDFKDAGFTKQLVFSGGGKEESSNLWQTVELAFKDPFVQSRSKIVNTILGTTWMFGLSSDFSDLCMTANGVGMMRYLSSGQVTSWLFPLSSLVPSLRQHLQSESITTKENGMEQIIQMEFSKGPSIMDVINVLGAANAGTLQELSEHFGLCSYHVVQTSGDILYVPPAYFLAEQSTEGMLVYGVRRGCIVCNDLAASGYEQYMALASIGSKDKSKMEEILAAVMPE